MARRYVFLDVVARSLAPRGPGRDQGEAEGEGSGVRGGDGACPEPPVCERWRERAEDTRL